MLTVARLLKVLSGLDPEAQVVVGIIEGERYNALDADPHVQDGKTHAYILCEQHPRPWQELSTQVDVAVEGSLPPAERRPGTSTT